MCTSLYCDSAYTKFQYYILCCQPEIFIVKPPPPLSLSLSLSLSLCPLDLRSKSVINMVAAQQHETWATLGFLRGISGQKMFGRAFCSTQWIDLMMGVITKASPLTIPRPTTRPLVQQVRNHQLDYFSLARCERLAA